MTTPSYSHLSPLAKEGIGLVEEQDGAAGLGSGEDAGQVLLGVANVLTDDGGEVDLVEVQAQLSSDDVRGHGLTRARGTGKEHVESLSQRELVVEAPLVVHERSVLHVATDLS